MITFLLNKYKQTNTQNMTTKYIICISQNPDAIIDELFGNVNYIYRYRSNYEYAELCPYKYQAKTYSSFKAAQNAAQKLIEKYSHYKGYKIVEVKKK